MYRLCYPSNHQEQPPDIYNEPSISPGLALRAHRAMRTSTGPAGMSRTIPPTSRERAWPSSGLAGGSVVAGVRTRPSGRPQPRSFPSFRRGDGSARPADRVRAHRRHRERNIAQCAGGDRGDKGRASGCCRPPNPNRLAWSTSHQPERQPAPQSRSVATSYRVGGRLSVITTAHDPIATAGPAP
jgi:hypothetical protein